MEAIIGVAFLLLIVVVAVIVHWTDPIQFSEWYCSECNQYYGRGLFGIGRVNASRAWDIHKDMCPDCGGIPMPHVSTRRPLIP